MVRNAGCRQGPKRWRGGRSIREERTGRLKGLSTGGDAEQTYKHRARDALGLADLRPLGLRSNLSEALSKKDFDKPRCREASRPVGPRGPKAFRAPSHFFEERRKKTVARLERYAKAGDRKCFSPRVSFHSTRATCCRRRPPRGRPNNTGDDACADVCAPKR
jgi:hypothetical protein